MFFLFGTCTVDRDKKGGLLERRHCARCGMISDMRERTRRQYFSLFFIPVIPISKAEPILTCNRCKASYGFEYRWNGPDPEPEKTVLECPGCSGKLRIPSRFGRALKVKCPHCHNQFTVSVERS